MKSETNGQEEVVELEKVSRLHTLTPFSKYLAMALFIILPFIGGWIGYKYAPEKLVEVERVVTNEIERSEVSENDSSEGLVSYTSDSLGINFEYSGKLILSESDGVVELHHDIPYSNSGDCDMIGDVGTEYERLTDFKLTFEVLSPKVVPDYIDGEFERGVWAYQGVEGCGVTKYYIDLDDSRTLVLTRDNIQALSGIGALWRQKEILAVPGVISSERNEEMFSQVLQSLTVDSDHKKPEESAGRCVTQGCSGTICIDENEFNSNPFATTCEYLPVYACYKTTECVRQVDGECGWTETEEFSACIDENR